MKKDNHSLGKKTIVVGMLVVFSSVACPLDSGDDEPRADASRLGPSIEVSPDIAQARDTITIRVHSPLSALWDLETFLDRRVEQGWEAYLVLIAGPEGPVGEFSALGKPEGIYPVGIQGNGVLKARVPDVAPGIYRLRKVFTVREGDKQDDVQAVAKLRIS